MRPWRGDAKKKKRRGARRQRKRKARSGKWDPFVLLLLGAITDSNPNPNPNPNPKSKSKWDEWRFINYYEVLWRNACFLLLTPNPWDTERERERERVVCLWMYAFLFSYVWNFGCECDFVCLDDWVGLFSNLSSLSPAVPFCLSPPLFYFKDHETIIMVTKIKFIILSPMLLAFFN